MASRLLAECSKSISDAKQRLQTAKKDLDAAQTKYNEAQADLDARLLQQRALTLGLQGK